jgi:uncharacterized alkaline shock family protein YloU
MLIAQVIQFATEIKSVVDNIQKILCHQLADLFHCTILEIQKYFEPLAHPNFIGVFLE